jgi:hypothetical protein
MRGQNDPPSHEIDPGGLESIRGVIVRIERIDQINGFRTKIDQIEQKIFLARNPEEDVRNDSDPVLRKGAAKILLIEIIEKSRIFLRLIDVFESVQLPAQLEDPRAANGFK